VLLTALPYDDVVRFIVRDTGREFLPSASVKFSSLSIGLGVELTQQEGSGIGLTIGRRLVQAMDGKIGFESFVGQTESSGSSCQWPRDRAKMARVPSLFAHGSGHSMQVLYH